jgi:vacuolar-type H+-ATPase subunit H
MAGEVIRTIKEKEVEASDLVTKARTDAKKLLEKTRAEKTGLIGEKDRLLGEEENRIRGDYAKQTAEAVKEIESEEKDAMARITAACEKNMGKVVDYISVEIVKE